MYYFNFFLNFFNLFWDWGWIHYYSKRFSEGVRFEHHLGPISQNQVQETSKRENEGIEENVSLTQIQKPQEQEIHDVTTLPEKIDEDTVKDDQPGKVKCFPHVINIASTLVVFSSVRGLGV